MSGPLSLVERPVAAAAVPRRHHHRLPGVVAVAGAHRGGLLVQRRPVAHDLAGLFVPLVLGRSDAVGVAQRRAAHRAAADPQAGRDRDLDHRSPRHAVRDRHRPLARPAARRRELPDAAVVRAARGAARRRAAVRDHHRGGPGPARHHRAGDRPGHLPGVLSGDPRAGAAGHHRSAIRGSRNGSRRVAARRAAPDHPADADACDLREHRAGVRRRDRRLRAGALPVRRRLHRTGLGEDLQHRARRADARAQRPGHACCCSPRWPPS